MSEVVDAKLVLKPIGRFHLGAGHDAGVVEQHIDIDPIVAHALAEVSDAGKVIKRKQAVAEGATWHELFQPFDSGFAFVVRPCRDCDIVALLAQSLSSLESDPRISTYISAAVGRGGFVRRS